MNALDLFTWIAAVVLIAGSCTVFVWFLLDVRTLLRSERAERAQRGDDYVA